MQPRACLALRAALPHRTLTSPLLLLRNVPQDASGAVPGVVAATGAGVVAAGGAAALAVGGALDGPSSGDNSAASSSSSIASSSSQAGSGGRGGWIDLLRAFVASLGSGSRAAPAAPGEPGAAGESSKSGTPHTGGLPVVPWGWGKIFQVGRRCGGRWRPRPLLPAHRARSLARHRARPPPIRACTAADAGASVRACARECAASQVHPGLPLLGPTRGPACPPPR